MYTYIIFYIYEVPYMLEHLAAYFKQFSKIIPVSSDHLLKKEWVTLELIEKSVVSIPKFLDMDSQKLHIIVTGRKQY